ncbi:uncharacterized protein LOC130668749 [Microplitis mediator]|uniref:uncharacterized protein LOC130668749 n=1 Tax=Microplitis mediator TaxID=375433 RepID=UPI0025552CD8|nr:uncharacterized protein LOC130668749 [Microplitis mediator]XP_057327164.1 uncharacterized protein LOC130668749 [Microplitis mediator]XP_057327165.1 uncharacterized protein LOC130668749 [Microplitis mediator]XP_057327166.1 uncharacterized protein LOC130668749 [Microplitis mediator]XP_057327167.1 uncharacterized protein LOC130668749 [Microplitis mediator]XP_057327169.1 uncharacterized protein LOC130668749 [Microplitis mediator]XP_057327170.1 uncharacterized protein LOC130668749 [Microplitis 
MASGINYLTIKLIIILIINLASNATNAFDPYDDLMISPNTLDIHAERSDENDVDVTGETDVYRATKTYNYYNNFYNTRDNTFVLNILLILDNPVGNEQLNETRYTDNVLSDFHFAARSFNKLDNPKIKLHISGVVKMKDLNTEVFTIKRETSLGVLECYGTESAHSILSQWFFESLAKLAKIDYDMFIFVSNKRLCPQNNGLSDGPVDYLGRKHECENLKPVRIPIQFHQMYRQQRKILLKMKQLCDTYNGSLDGPAYYIPKNIDCINKGTSGYPSGGLLYYGNLNAKLHVTQMIAEKFGVRNDSYNGCASGPDNRSYMNLENDSQDSSWLRSWSECSKADFAKIIDDEKYECYKMPTVDDVGENNETGYQNLILGPNTYVHKIDFPHDNYVRVNSYSNIFKATPTYNYYRNSSVDLSKKYVINLLLIHDWRLNEINGNSDTLRDSILKKLNIVAENLNKLEHIEIKLRISGIVLPQRSDIFDLPETQKMPLWETSCYHFSESLDYLSNWLLEYKDRFEDLSYDFFLFVTGRPICDQSNGRKFEGGAILINDCNSPFTSVKSGGLVQYDRLLSLHVTRMIAVRFNISKDDVPNCGSGHIMDYGGIETCVTAINPRSWSNCSQLGFESIFSSPAYSCNQMPAFKPDDEEEEDYE